MKLASFRDGWATVCRNLNLVQYRIAKSLLGIRSVSLGDGGMIKTLYECGFSSRLSTWVAKQIIVGRARLLVLPPDNPVGNVVKAARETCGETWLDHARMVQTEMGVTVDFERFLKWDALDRCDPVRRKAAVDRWKLAAVTPVLGELEWRWFLARLSKLNEEGLLPYREILPLRQPLVRGVGWAGWSKSSWRFYRAWCAARVSQGFPFSVWGGRAPALVKTFQVCPLCGQVGADLRHVLSVCSGTSAERCALSVSGDVDFLIWVFTDEPNLDLLLSKVCFVRRCFTAVLAGWCVVRL